MSANNLILKQNWNNLQGEPRVNSLKAHINKDGLLLVWVESGPEKKACVGLDSNQIILLKLWLEEKCSAAKESLK